MRIQQEFKIKYIIRVVAGTLPATLLPEPTLLVGIEERVHQIVAIVLGYLKGFGAYGVVQ